MGIVTAATKRCSLRMTAELAAWLLIAAAMLHAWIIQGLVVPCQVVGGSMTPGLLGTHRLVLCGDCGYRFDCDADRRPLPTTVVCPNCAYAANQLDSLPDVPGDRVLISPAAFALRHPRRWEVVALRRPSHADQIILKRVVGLPGEAVELRAGDLYVDGSIRRKSLAEQRALAVLVYDAITDRTLQPPRWQNEPAGRWKPIEGGFAHTTVCDDEPVDWLVYHHARRTNPTLARTTSQDGKSHAATAPRASMGPAESSVTDLDSYDQTQPRRAEDVHAVADLMLSLRLRRQTGVGTFYVRATDGAERFEMRLRFFGTTPARYQVLRGGRLLPGAEGDIPDAAAVERQIEISLIDQQFLLAFDGQTVVRWPYERSERPAPSTTPVAIAVQRLNATVRELRLFRDVYYGEPIGRPTRGPVRLGSNEYYVLGDNSSISEDSRHWPGRGAVDGNLLIGKPLAAMPSVAVSPWAAWHFQVPNPARIRYIP